MIKLLIVLNDIVEQAVLIRRQIEYVIAIFSGHLHLCENTASDAVK